MNLYFEPATGLMVLCLVMSIKPLEIRRLGSTGIHITWADGLSSEISSDALRRDCPCAECRMQTPKKSLLKIIEHSKEDSTTLENVWAVGQYAVGLKWRDGHDSGIYTFPLLRELSTRV